MSDWISVKDKLPDSKQIVLGYTPADGFMFVGFLERSKVPNYTWERWRIITAMRSTKKITKKVTHWMPLPEAPECFAKGEKD